MATIEITGANTLALGGFFSKWRDLPPHDQEPAPNMVDAGFAKRLGQFLTDWEKNTHDASLLHRLELFFEQYRTYRLSIKPRISHGAVVRAYLLDDLPGFFQGFRLALHNHLEKRQFGSSLNVWDASGIGWDEMRNSKVLAWLLDCRGSHGQGHGILGALLDCVQDRAEHFPASSNIKKRYWTRLESCPTGSRDSRVDIEIDGDDFLLFIEVKIGANETTDQLDRYLEIARSKSGGRRFGVMYLTRKVALPHPFKEVPNPHICAASWGDVVKAVERQLQVLPECFSKTVLRQYVQHIHDFALK